MATPIIHAQDAIKQICEALEIPYERCQRVVIDLEYRGVPVIYVQMLGDKRMLEINWKEALGVSAVTVLGGAKRET